jgi:hypothetical protein
MKAAFSFAHETAICFDMEVSTAEVGMGNPLSSAILLLSFCQRQPIPSSEAAQLGQPSLPRFEACAM